MNQSIPAIAAFCVLVMAPLSLAQHRGPNLEQMQEHLELSDTQVEEIRQIRAGGGSREDIHAVLTEEQQQKLRAHRMQMRGQGKGPNLERMQQHLGLSDEQVAQIRQIKAEGGSREDIEAVLTDEQRQKMVEHRKQRQGKRQNASASH